MVDEGVAAHAHWWNAPAFYPSTGVLGFSENLLSLVPIAAPFLAFTSTPLLAYNVLFLLSYVLSGLGAYFFGLALTARRDAAFVAALAFAFAPYRLSHLNHLQLLSSYWMPVSLAALHLYLKNRRPAFAILFAGAWLLQALASGYYMFFLSLLVVLWLAWFGIRRLDPRQLATVAVCWIAAAIIMTPLLLGYRGIHLQLHGLRRSPVEIAYYSADIAGIVSASEESLLWGRPSRGPQIEVGDVSRSHHRAGGRRPDGVMTRAVAEHRSRLMFYSGRRVLMWLLTLGPLRRCSADRWESRSVRAAHDPPGIRRDAGAGAAVDAVRALPRGGWRPRGCLHRQRSHAASCRHPRHRWPGARWLAAFVHAGGGTRSAPSGR